MVIPAAYLALKLGAGGDNGFDDSMFDGRDVTHWSSHLLIAGSLVGLVTLIGGLALGHMIVAIQGGMLLTSNGIGAYYINKFSVFHAAGEVIQALGKRIHTFWTQNVKLLKQVERAEEVNKNLYASISTLSEIVEDRKRLQTEKIQYLKKLELAQKRLEETNKSYHALMGAVDQFVIATNTLSASENGLSEHLKTLIEQIKNIEKVSRVLKNEVGELQDGCREIVNQREKIEFTVKSLEQIELNWPKKYEDLREENEKLKKQVSRLQHMIGRLKLMNQEMERIQDRLISSLK